MPRGLASWWCALTPSRGRRRTLTMHLYYLHKDGIGPARHAAKRGFISVAGMRNVLYGLAAFGTQIEPAYGASIRQGLDTIAWPT